jgi:hypothetical protein
MELKLFCDAPALYLSNHVKGKLLKDSVISDGVGFRQSLPVNGCVAETREKRFLTMSDCYICKFSNPTTARTSEPACDSSERATSLWSCRRTWQRYA